MERNYQRYAIGDSEVVIFVGNILESTADVLVSSDDHNFSMSGGVSKAIRDAGGSLVFEGARREAGKHGVGDVIATSAGDIASASEIYHGISRLDGSRPGDTDAEHKRTTTRLIVEKSMARFAASGYISIAFPAIGTGYGGFDPADVAVAMAQTVADEIRQRELAVTVELYIHPPNLASNLNFLEFFRHFVDQSGWEEQLIRDHAVIMIHGIRTEARWFDTVSKLLRDVDPRINPIPTGYGIYDVLRFLIPTDLFKKAVIDEVEETIVQTLNEPSQREVSVVAHSFGTYIVTRILCRNRNIQLKRLILCGSVVSRSYPWDKVRDRLTVLDESQYPTQRVINDCGWRDIWPIFAQTATFGYGSSGRLGFNKGNIVVNRFHDMGHSGFFDADFVEEYWCSLLTNNEVVPNDEERPAMSYVLSLLVAFKMIVVIPVAIVAWMIFA